MIAFHVAPEGARERIRESGLLPSSPNPRWARYELLEQPTGVYLWISYDRAVRWARDFLRLVGGEAIGRSDLWRVRVDGFTLWGDPVLGEQGARLVRHAIEPARVSLCHHAEDLA